MDNQQQKTSMQALVFFFGCAAFAVGLRMFPHTPNYAAMGALAIFSGSLFNSKKFAFLPFLVVFLSDAFIGFYEPLLMATVYLSYALMFFIGHSMKKATASGVVLRATLASSLFYLTTNFAVWAFTPWYSKTLADLVKVYIQAIPFYRNTFISDLIFTAAFFAAYQLSTAIYGAHAKKKALATTN